MDPFRDQTLPPRPDQPPPYHPRSYRFPSSRINLYRIWALVFAVIAVGLNLAKVGISTNKGCHHSHVFDWVGFLFLATAIALNTADVTAAAYIKYKNWTPSFQLHPGWLLFLDLCLWGGLVGWGVIKASGAGCAGRNIARAYGFFVIVTGFMHFILFIRDCRAVHKLRKEALKRARAEGHEAGRVEEAIRLEEVVAGLRATKSSQVVQVTEIK